MFYTCVNLYDETEFRLERNEVEYKFYVNSIEGIAGTERVELSTPPLVTDRDYYLPLKDLCELFGYEYSWDMKTAELSVTSTDNTVSSLPKSFDLRRKDRAASIKNQGNTQTCWAYAAYGAMESSLLPQEPVSLNPKELIDKKPYEYPGRVSGGLGQGPFCQAKKAEIII